MKISHKILYFALFLITIFALPAWGQKALKTEEITLENGEKVTVRRNVYGQIIGRNRKILKEKGVLEQYDVKPPKIEEGPPLTEEQRRDVDFMWKRHMDRYQRGMAYVNGETGFPSDSVNKKPGENDGAGITKVLTEIETEKKTNQASKKKNVKKSKIRKPKDSFSLQARYEKRKVKISYYQ